MKVSRGKDFENEIRQAFLRQRDISIDRFPDPMAGYAGIRNICDFVVYRYPFQYYFECKTISKNTLNFKSGITKNQWEGLIEKSDISGVLAGIIVWFIDHDETVFVPILELKRIREEEGAKSLNIKDINQNKVIFVRVPGEKRRILFTYDARIFLNRINLLRWWDNGEEGESCLKY